tara:strand:+ start:720 stop:896 length:177 start_codon:yes stop_codon:yes gene_type:complete
MIAKANNLDHIAACAVVFKGNAAVEWQSDDAAAFDEEMLAVITGYLSFEPNNSSCDKR